MIWYLGNVRLEVGEANDDGDDEDDDNHDYDGNDDDDGDGGGHGLFHVLHAVRDGAWVGLGGVGEVARTGGSESTV